MTTNYFNKKDWFGKLFDDETLAPYIDLLFPQKSLQRILRIYRLKHTKVLLGMDNDLFVSTLNMLKVRAAEPNFYVKLSEQAGIFPFVIGNDKPFVLLVPGGGYQNVYALNEGFMVASKLNELGYNAFVARYSVGKFAHFPAPQDDLAQIIKWIFANAKDMSIDCNDYAVCGFSAGGHLAASWGTKTLGYAKYNLPKPKTLVLSYPVITMGEYAHKGSRKYLLAEHKNDGAMREKYSIEKQIDKDYPDTFVWQCERDCCVPYRNSLLLVDALRQNGCNYKFNHYHGRAHGWGLGIGTDSEGWLEQAVDFWQSSI